MASNRYAIRSSAFVIIVLLIILALVNTWYQDSGAYGTLFTRVLPANQSLPWQSSSQPLVPACWNQRRKDRKENRSSVGQFNAGATQASRQYNIRKECAKNSLPEIPLACPKLEVIHRYKLVMLMTPKTGGTNWARLLLTLLGAHNYTEKIEPRLSNREFHKRVPYLNKFKKTDQENVLKTYRIVINVRNPYTRLLSAFRDRLEMYPNRHLGQRKVHNKKIYMKFGNHSKDEWPDKSVPSYMYNVTFRAFVDYYLAGHKDVHWIEQHKYCHPCFGFDYIAKKETYAEDAITILRLINADPKYVPYSPLNPTNSGDDEILGRYYSTLSDEQFKKLMKKLDIDLRYYNYSIPEIIRRPHLEG